MAKSPRRMIVDVPLRAMADERDVVGSFSVRPFATNFIVDKACSRIVTHGVSPLVHQNVTLAELVNLNDISPADIVTLYEDDVEPIQDAIRNARRSRDRVHSGLSHQDAANGETSSAASAVSTVARTALRAWNSIESLLGWTRKSSE